MLSIGAFFRLIFLVLLCFSIVLLAGCGGPKAGVVSLTPGITETLYALGAGDQLVGVSGDSDYPADVRTLPRVGDRYQPDMEALQLLSPSLVFSSRTDRALADWCMESQAGFFTVNLDTLAGLEQDLTFLGGLIGASSAAARLYGEIDADLAAVRGRVAEKARVRALLIVDRAPGKLEGMAAAGGVSLISELAAVAGCENVFGEEQRPALEVSQEEIRGVAPEVIIELRPGQSLTENQRQEVYNAWKRLEGVPAAENGRIYVMNQTHALRAGPRVGEIAGALADLVYGEEMGG
jgi:iron complex transport system substrate-binding protein